MNIKVYKSDQVMTICESKLYRYEGLGWSTKPSKPKKSAGQPRKTKTAKPQ